MPGARARARARVGAGQPRRAALDLVTLSGPRRQGPGRGAGAQLMSLATTGVDRIAAAFASHGKRAALMPYLMGGYPVARGLARDAGRPRADAGADLIELGIPFSDPLADGPVIHAAATAGAGRRAPRPHGVLRRLRAALASACRWC